MTGIDLWRYPDLLELPRDCTYESNEEVLGLLEMRWREWLQVGGKLAHEIHLPLSAIRDIHDYTYGGSREKGRVCTMQLRIRVQS